MRANDTTSVAMAPKATADSVSEINSDNIFKPFDVAGHELRTLWTTCG